MIIITVIFSPAVMDHNTLLYQMVQKKGYVRLQTSFGDLNLELHCDLVPLTCHNFIQLCKQGYYNDTSGLKGCINKHITVSISAFL